MNILTKFCLFLICVGGINWGMIGAFNFDLVQFIFGKTSLITKGIYILVGLATIWVTISYFYNPYEEIK